MTATPPLLDRISDYADHWSRQTPDSRVFVTGEGTTTYGELQDRLGTLARALIAAGIGPGDRVVLLSTPRPLFIEMLLATACIGAVWVGLNPRFTAAEIAGILADAGPRLILAQMCFEDTDFVDVLEEARALSGDTAPMICLDGDDPRCIAFADFLAAGNTVPDTELDTRRKAVGAQDAAVMVYTSGSTGKPKGVLLSHHSLCFVYRQQIIDYGTVGGSYPACLPINHVGGIGFVGCNPLIGGGSMVFTDRFDPGAVLDRIHRSEIDSVLLLSGMIESLVAHPTFATTDFSRVRAIVWGGAALSKATVERLQSCNCRLATLYGMSEMPGNVAVTRPDATLEELTETVGRVSGYMDLRLADDQGRDCSPGEPGEIRLRHSTRFLGYHGNPTETAASIDDRGYFRTGDIGTLDAAGNLRIVGRLKEMFKSGGYNVFPGEIETCIQLCPEVAIAAVVAVPDTKFQEVGWAYVVPRDTTAGPEFSATVARWCDDKLANYKRPKKIVPMADLPRLPSGKVDKRALADMARATLETAR